MGFVGIAKAFAAKKFAAKILMVSNNEIQAGDNAILLRIVVFIADVKSLAILRERLFFEQKNSCNMAAANHLEPYLRLSEYNKTVSRREKHFSQQVIIPAILI